MNYEKIHQVISDIYVDHHIGILGFNPITMAKELGIVVIPYNQFSTSKEIFKKFDEDGFSLFNPKSGRCEIYFNDEVDPYERTFFTVPHETGHIEIGHVFESNGYTNYQELEANFFARNYYMPQIILERENLLSSYRLKKIFHITDAYAEIVLEKYFRRKRKSSGNIKYSYSEERLYESFCYNRNLNMKK